MKTEDMHMGVIFDVMGVGVADNCVAVAIKGKPEILIPFCTAWDFLDTDYPLEVRGMFGETHPVHVGPGALLRPQQVDLVEVSEGCNVTNFHKRQLLIRDRFGNAISWDLYCEGHVDRDGLVIPAPADDPAPDDDDDDE